MSSSLKPGFFLELVELADFGGRAPELFRRHAIDAAHLLIGPGDLAGQEGNADAALDQGLASQAIVEREHLGFFPVVGVVEDAVRQHAVDIEDHKLDLFGFLKRFLCHSSSSVLLLVRFVSCFRQGGLLVSHLGHLIDPFIPLAHGPQYEFTNLPMGPLPPGAVVT